MNLSIFGYGAKGFTLSMIEAAVRITDAKITADDLMKLVDLGKSLLTVPIDILDSVEKVLSSLQGKYKLVVATKGDLQHCERLEVNMNVKAMCTWRGASLKENIKEH